MDKRKWLKCVSCNKRKADVELRFNAYASDVNDYPDDECWMNLCADCAEDLRDDI